MSNPVSHSVVRAANYPFSDTPSSFCQHGQVPVKIAEHIDSVFIHLHSYKLTPDDIKPIQDYFINSMNRFTAHMNREDLIIQTPDNFAMNGKDNWLIKLRNGVTELNLVLDTKAIKKKLKEKLSKEEYIQFNNTYKKQLTNKANDEVKAFINTGLLMPDKIKEAMADSMRQIGYGYKGLPLTEDKFENSVFTTKPAVTSTPQPSRFSRYRPHSRSLRSQPPPQTSTDNTYFMPRSFSLRGATRRGVEKPQISAPIQQPTLPHTSSIVQLGTGVSEHNKMSTVSEQHNKMSTFTTPPLPPRDSSIKPNDPLKDRPALGNDSKKSAAEVNSNDGEQLPPPPAEFLQELSKRNRKMATRLALAASDPPKCEDPSG